MGRMKDFSAGLRTVPAPELEVARIRVTARHAGAYLPEDETGRRVLLSGRHKSNGIVL